CARRGYDEGTWFAYW
nr:immunoglobulin heavy chain junction region [Mus musculus]